MPRKTEFIQCTHFRWKLFQRNDNGVIYADGRSHNQFNLGKHSLSTRDRKEALKILQQLDIVKAIEHGLAQPEECHTSKSSIPIAAGWEELYAHAGRGEMLGGVAEQSLRRYQNCGRKHIEFCEQIKIRTWNDFNEKVLARYGKLLNKKYAPATVYSFLLLVKMANRRLVDEGKLPQNCLLKSKLTRTTGTDRYCYSREEVTAMVTLCLNDPKLRWMGRLMLVLSHTGMRIGELLALQVSDIDWQSGTILVADERYSRVKNKKGTARRTKNSKSRRVPIHQSLKQHLSQMINKAPNGYLFQNTDGSRLEYHQIRAVLKEEVIAPLQEKFPTEEDAIGFADGTFHSFRHYFCSQCFISGASEGEVKEWLGHSDSKMVEHYRHLRNEESQRKMKQLLFLDEQSGTSTPGNITAL